jgi:hypothetical protein
MVTMSDLAKFNNESVLTYLEPTWNWVLNNYHGVFRDEDHMMETLETLENDMMYHTEILNLPANLRNELNIW